MIKNLYFISIFFLASLFSNPIVMSGQELTARMDLGVDFTSGSFKNGSGSYYYPYAYDEVSLKQWKIGAVRRFLVGKWYVEPIIGFGYAFYPGQILVNGVEKKSHPSVGSGLEIITALEYNITKKWALRLQTCANNTDASFTAGIRYSFFYNEK